MRLLAFLAVSVDCAQIMLDVVFQAALLNAQSGVVVSQSLLLDMIGQFRDAARSVYQFAVGFECVLLMLISQTTNLASVIKAAGQCLGSHAGHLYYLGSDAFGMMG
jgi:hypothetical protein